MEKQKIELKGQIELKKYQTYGITMKTKRIKVAFIAHNPPYRGGIVQYSILLANELCSNIDLTLVGFKCLYPQFLYKGVIPKNEKVDLDFTIPIQRVIKWFSPWSWYQAYRCASKSDIIHINWVTAFLGIIYWSILLFNKFGAQRKIVITCHNITDHEPIPFAKFFTRRVFEQADLLIVHAEENKERLIKNFNLNDDCIKIIPHGDFSFFKAFMKNNSNPMNEKKHPSEKYILFWGYIRKYKGLRYLLKAFPNVLKTCQNTHLLIAGECWENANEYRKIIQELNIKAHVSFIPEFIPDREVWMYFDISDLVVLPYHNTEQTISGPLLTSMAFGKATIVGNCGGIKNMIDNNINGVLVESNDKNLLAEKIISLLEDDNLRTKIGINAQKTIQKYNWKMVASMIISSYQDLPLSK